YSRARRIIISTIHPSYAYTTLSTLQRSYKYDTHQNLGHEATHGPRPGREQEEGAGERLACDTDPGERLDDRTIGVREEAVQRRHRRIAGHRRCRRNVSDVLHGDAHMEVAEGRLDGPQDQGRVILRLRSERERRRADPLTAGPAVDVATDRGEVEAESGDPEQVTSHRRRSE